MSVLEKIRTILSKGFIWLGGISLLVLVGIACANMLLRPMGAPLKGAYELVGFFAALTVAFALGYAQIFRSHIAVDILSSRYSKRTQRIMDAVSAFISTIFFGLVAWQTFLFADAISRRGETSETLRIIYHPFVYVVAVCCGLLAFVLLIDFIKVLGVPPAKRENK